MLFYWVKFMKNNKDQELMVFCGTYLLTLVFTIYNDIGMSFSVLFLMILISLFPCIFIFYLGEKTMCLIKSITRKHLAYAVISVLLAVGYYFAFSERTYADCILHNMKEAKTNDIATAIKSACRAKYGY